MAAGSCEGASGHNFIFTVKQVSWAEGYIVKQVMCTKCGEVRETPKMREEVQI